MKTIERTVVAGNPPHEEKIALVVLCEHCDGELFGIFVVDGHQHLLCAGCGVSYCDREDCGAT